MDKIDPRWDIPGSPEFIQNPGSPGLDNLFQCYSVEKSGTESPYPFRTHTEKTKKGTYRFLRDGTTCVSSKCSPPELRSYKQNQGRGYLFRTLPEVNPKFSIPQKFSGTKDVGACWLVVGRRGLHSHGLGGQGKSMGKVRLNAPIDLTRLYNTTFVTLNFYSSLCLFQEQKHFVAFGSPSKY